MTEMKQIDKLDELNNKFDRAWKDWKEGKLTDEQIEMISEWYVDQVANS